MKERGRKNYTSCSTVSCPGDDLTLCETHCPLAKQASTEVHYYLDTETVL